MSAESQRRMTGRVTGRRGAFSVQAGGMVRTASSYEAPAGDFGDITLDERLGRVRDHLLDLARHE